MLQSNKTFIIANFYEIIRLKLRGKQRYFILPHNADISSYSCNLSVFDFDENTRRYYFENISDLSKIEELLLSLADSAFDAFMFHKANVKAAKKHLNEYLKAWYYK